MVQLNRVLTLVALLVVFPDSLRADDHLVVQAQSLEAAAHGRQIARSQQAIEPRAQATDSRKPVNVEVFPQGGGSGGCGGKVRIDDVGHLSFSAN
jgi:hypothetical protein